MFFEHKGQVRRRVGPRLTNDGLLLGDAAALDPSALLARLLEVGVLFQLAQDPALLQLHIEALQRGIDRLVLLDDHIDQARDSSVKRSLWSIFRELDKLSLTGLS